MPWNLEPARSNPESWMHPRGSRNSTAASAVSPASASREPTGTVSVPFLPPPKPLPLSPESSTGEDLQMPGWASTSRAEGAPGGWRRRGKLSRAGREELELSQALLTVFLTWQW